MRNRKTGWRALLALALFGAAGGALAQAPGSVERGRYLMEGVVACGNCHFQRGPRGEPLVDKGLSGGMVFDEPSAFKAYAANITPDAETGIGRWTDAQLVKAIREGIRPDGSVIGPPMPIEFYRHLADDDVNAIVAYLRTQPAVKHAVPKSTFQMPLPPAWGPAVSGVKAPAQGDKVAYGKYLADIGHCMECHTPRNAQGLLVQGQWGAGGQVLKGPWGASVTRNLTPHATGLRDWTDAQIETAIRTGRNREGQPYRPPMAFDFYRTISADDMGALIAYLRSLPPMPMGGKP